MRNVIIFLALLPALLASAVSTASAQVFPLRVITRECDLRNCQTFTVRGSAVYLGRTRGNGHVFLTAGHNLAPVSANTVLIDKRQVEIGVGNRWIPARTIGSREGKGVDLSLLAVQAEIPVVECLPLAQTPLLPNARVSLVGYTHTGARLELGGNVTRTDFVNYPYAINQRPVHGQSGGAVIANGHLAGIIRGFPNINDPLCFYSDTAAIRALLNETLRYDPICVPEKRKTTRP